MSRRPGPLDADLGEVFTVAAALEAGITPARLRSRDLERPFHGVRRRGRPLPADASTVGAAEHSRRGRAIVLSDAAACLAVAPAHAFLAGRSAAVAWDLPCDPGDQLCVGVLAPHRAPRRPGVRGVKLSPTLASVVMCSGIRATSPATTWAYLADTVSFRDLVRIGDAIVRIPRDERARRLPGQQLATPAELLAAAQAPGRRRRGILLRALDEIRVGAMSPLETDFRLLALGEALPEPVLDAEIRDASGRLLGIADALYERYAVIVEIEGDHHRTSREQWLRDLQKHAAYAAAGYELVRLGASQIRGRGADGARVVRAVLERRGWRGQLS
ncbi:hypothetical protein DEU37_1059 [Microbacterium sp. AG790]|uniref:hypothetical protein n=1 Tax=Microbacterium sp. AG790 TaxID=2183995 RepID=UPI000F0FA9C4|nr:hypothetical protein [Microbacterium sp. AG790]RKS93642.1 hypothetical protein DEU37_1059 [Microbacterium sp. AG790]